ncbi:hypothetical protein [Flavobacterium sp. KACC 22761]|uniref:hypothetical protein n=1 Tax=Flavobacterium sp. KACC 22761 TaxID=3092665 RepID=UPI002A75A9C6|nr:hypothetical protein [Flavobacterium sp. KACC 22761]WPO79115.1 hypothetical protein SCB73_01725 [Flavobacterium sp. KACC 22761]
MGTELQLKIKRSLLDNYERDLHLHPDFIKFEDKDLANNGFTSFNADEIKEFCFGVTFYQYRFVFGREYEILIKNFNDEILKIKIKSYLGIKKHQTHQLYAKIINAVWDLYFAKQVDSFVKEFEAGESFTIGEVNINPEGVIISISKLLKQEKKLIPWSDVALRKYSSYISIYSKENALDFNRGYSFKKDWNTFVLYNVIKNILDNKKTNND